MMREGKQRNLWVIKCTWGHSVVVSREWRGQGRNELPAGEYEREDCLKKPESSHMTNGRKRLSCWHYGVLSSEQ